MKINRTKQVRATRMVIYGVAGVGKTMLASKCPNPIVVDCDDGAGYLGVPRVETRKWETIMQAVRELTQKEHEFQTVAIDTIDLAENMLLEWQLAKDGKRSLIEYPYGTGYASLSQHFQTLLQWLNALNRKRINILLLAHCNPVRVDKPDEQGGYDAWSLATSKRITLMIEGWADAVLFAKFKSRVVSTGDGQAKGVGGQERILLTQNHDAYLAKNRYGLPAEIPFSYDKLAPIFTGGLANDATAKNNS